MAKQSVGHAAHTKPADDPRGLNGKISRPFKVTMIGAGSGFTPRLMNDILRIPGAERGEIALVDIDRNRLSTMHKLITRLTQRLGRDGGWNVTASPNRRSVLKGTDYLINCIEVSGLACVKYDNDIPLKYGVDQCIGDTIGPGGLMKSLRTIPVFLEVLKDAERLCPQALVLNYTNPMSMMCAAAGRTSRMKIVGLCHSVQGTSHLLARRAGVPYEEMEWDCAGINHLAWFTRLRHQGKDLYPILIEKAKRDLAGKPADRNDGWDLVRKDMMVHFGAFITESSGHLSEYLPYYRKRKDLMKKYMRPRYDGESRFYASNWPSWRKWADRERAEMVAGKKEMNWTRSWEYASWIIEAREKDCPFRIHGNVMNTSRGAGGLISNLPDNNCVEVACMIDRNGINPTRYGRLPEHMAGVCESNMRMIGIGADAAIHKSFELAYQSLLLDPLTSAVCSPAEIRKMAFELFKAEQPYLPGYK